MKKLNHLIFRTLTAIAVTVVIAGCATFKTGSSENFLVLAIAPLPADESLYVYMDVDASREALEPVMVKIAGENPMMETALENLEYLFLAVSKKADEVRFVVTGVGEILEFAIAAGLDWDRKWKRNPGQFWWWTEVEAGLQLALPARNFVTVSNTDLSRSLAVWDGNRIIDEYGTKEQFSSAVLAHFGSRDLVLFASALSDLPGIELPRVLTDSSAVLFLGDFEGRDLVGDILLELESPTAARLAGVLVRIFVIADRKLQGTGYFENSEVVAEQASVRIGPIRIDSARIVELLGGVP